MALTDNHAGADCAWTNKYGHGNRTGEMLRFSAQNFNCRWPFEYKLESDQEKYHAAKYLEGCKLCLHDTEENEVA